MSAESLSRKDIKLETFLKAFVSGNDGDATLF